MPRTHESSSINVVITPAWSGLLATSYCASMSVLNMSQVYVWVSVGKLEQERREGVSGPSGNPWWGGGGGSTWLSNEVEQQYGCTRRHKQSSWGGNNYCNLHFQIVVMPPKHTPSHKWVGAIFQVLEAYKVSSNERGSLMVIDRAHKDGLGLASEAAHSAYLMK